VRFICKYMTTLFFILIIALLAECVKEIKPTMNIEEKVFGKTADGIPANLYILTNSNGMEVKITNYGGIVVSISVPDKNGKFYDVVLGYDTLEEYTRDNPYFGCIVGRYANRIAKGAFMLNGVEYTLAQNNNDNHLHGGIKGFDKVVWNAEIVRRDEEVGVKLTYLSVDGEEGYPGNLNVTVIYTLTDSDELKIDYMATTDRDTVVNLTNHSYFNLAGAGLGDVLGHEMMINADRFTPINANLIPTGELRSVEGTPLDFTRPETIGSRIDADDEQIKFGGGYDHNWVLNKSGEELSLAARVSDPATGRCMMVYTTEPGIQFYSGNFLDGSSRGKKGSVYHKRYAFCLETQHFPDSPNKPEFPSVVLKPAETYKQTTIYRFSVK
jgi:aldose 1-epimerase